MWGEKFCYLNSLHYCNRLSPPYLQNITMSYYHYFRIFSQLKKLMEITEFGVCSMYIHAIESNTYISFLLYMLNILGAS